MSGWYRYVAFDEKGRVKKEYFDIPLWTERSRRWFMRAGFFLGFSVGWLAMLAVALVMWKLT